MGLWTKVDPPPLRTGPAKGATGPSAWEVGAGAGPPECERINCQIPAAARKATITPLTPSAAATRRPRPVLGGVFAPALPIGPGALTGLGASGGRLRSKEPASPPPSEARA